MKRYQGLAYQRFAYAYICVAIPCAIVIIAQVSQIGIDRALTLTGGNVELPSHINYHLVDTNHHVEHKHRGIDMGVTPFYWHIPKAAGTSVHNEYHECLALVGASELGGIDQGNSLKLVQINDGNYHVNVDTSILPGIMHASELDLVPSHMAQIVFSPLLHESATYLFSPRYKGQMFAMFRHPVDRVISLFYYLRSATWEPTYNPSLRNMTLIEYAESELAESNFMVRALANKMEGALSEHDLELAKLILKQKCVVGLMDRWDASMDRFDFFFNFQSDGTRHEQARQCRTSLRDKGGSNKHKHPDISHTSAAYLELERKNGLDLQLYDHIQKLYVEQELITKGTDEEDSNTH